jgi:hypothetical protein
MGESNTSNSKKAKGGNEMIEKLKPQTLGFINKHNVKDTDILAGVEERGLVGIMLSDETNLKINEIIDIVNLLLQPHEATLGTIPLSQAPKKRTAREIVEAQRQEFMNGVYPEHASLVSVYDAILEAFDREGIE